MITTAVKYQYPKLLEGPDVMKANYCIALKEDAKPFHAPGPRKVHFSFYIDRILEVGIISRVENPNKGYP